MSEFGIHKSSHQVVLKKGEILFKQGEPSPDFYVLVSGKVEILIVEGVSAPSNEQIVKNSRRIAVLDDPKVPIGELGALGGDPRSVTIRALTPVKLVRMEGSGPAFQKWMGDNLAAGLSLAKALTKRFRRTYDRWRTLRAINQQLICILQNFTLAFADIEKAKLENKENSDQLVTGEMMPALLVRDDGLSDKTEEKVRRAEQEQIKGVDEQLGKFFGRLLLAPTDDLMWMTETDPEPIIFLATRLAEQFSDLNAAVRRQVSTTEKSLLKLSGAEFSMVSMYKSAWKELSDEKREELKPLYRRLISIGNEMDDVIIDLWGSRLPNYSETLKDLESCIGESRVKHKTLDEMHEQSGAIESTSAESAPSVEEEASMQILDVVLAIPTIPKELADGFREKIDNLDEDSVYKAATDDFWKIYAHVFRALLKESRPEWVIFCRYGMVMPEGLPMKGLSAFDPEGHKPGPIQFADEWLKRIYSGEAPPSRNELGQTFEELVGASESGRFDPDETDPQFDIVLYEIDNALKPAARGMAGGKATNPPWFHDPERLEMFETNSLNANNVAQELIKVIQLDYSAFYREVRILLGERSDFVLKDVLPNFIIVPAIGDRGLAWQEWEGKAKATPGRVFLPSQRNSIGLFELMCDVVAAFRWELNYSMAGPSAGDPINGGLTGAYSDYVQFYKKNSELSEEIRDKLKKFWSKAGQNRDKFALEYRLWIQYESEGLQKLNKVVRRIFVEHMPFPVEKRQDLASAPAFQRLLTVDSNKRSKKRRDLMGKIKKLKRDEIEYGDAFTALLRVAEPLPKEE